MAAFCQADASATHKLEVLTAQIERQPEQQLLLRRARVYIDNNQPTMARRDISTAETLGDPSAVCYVYGLLLYRQGDYSAARSQFNCYLKLHPEHRSSLDYRARLLRDAGEYDAALQDYRRLMSIDNQLAPGYYLSMARILAAMPAYGPEAALLAIDERIVEIGPVSSLQRYAISLEVEQGDYPAAIERLSTLDPKLRATPGWQVEMAELQLLAGRFDDALMYITLAREQLQVLKKTTAHQQLTAELEELTLNLEQQRRSDQETHQK